jgi:hypothetical protein
MSALLAAREYRFILQRDFTSFIERSFYELNPQTRLYLGPHIEVIASRLEACRQGRIKRLIINLPPRHLKSHCASIAFVAWYLGNHPAGRIICASYGQELADKLARDSRNIMSSAWYQSIFPTRLDRGAVHDFTTTELGYRMSTSVGGVLTGRGANVIIIDDPLKPDEALSEPRRKAVNEWYDNSLLSRLDDKTKGCIIIIMQRLHQEDLVGHVQEQEPWDVLTFPAIAEQDETFAIDGPLGKRCFTRRTGQALHPERETIETLAGIRERMGEYNFSSQYQQSPIRRGVPWSKGNGFNTTRRRNYRSDSISRFRAGTRRTSLPSSAISASVRPGVVPTESFICFMCSGNGSTTPTSNAKRRSWPVFT